MRTSVAPGEVTDIVVAMDPSSSEGPLEPRGQVALELLGISRWNATGTGPPPGCPRRGSALGPGCGAANVMWSAGRRAAAPSFGLRSASGTALGRRGLMAPSCNGIPPAAVRYRGAVRLESGAPSR